MSDIGHRIQRYRLSRYGGGAPRRVRHRLRWVVSILFGWILWAGFVSDHSFYRLWQLGRENTRQQAEMAKINEETQRLELELENPAALRALAERELREKNGMARPGEIVYRIKGAKPDTVLAD